MISGRCSGDKVDETAAAAKTHERAVGAAIDRLESERSIEMRGSRHVCGIHRHGTDARDQRRFIVQGRLQILLRALSI